MNNTTESAPAALTSFVFNSTTLRGGIVNGETLVVAKDVCDALGYSKHRDALQSIPNWALGRPLRVDAETGGKGSVQDMATLKEAGIYWLTLRSNKKEAEAFQRWVCEEVLPAIRRNGGYVVGGNAAERVTRLEQLLKVERGLLVLEAKRQALLDGKDAARGVAHPEGAVAILDYIRAHFPCAEIGLVRLITQSVRDRAVKDGRPVGKIRTTDLLLKNAARPEDIEALITPAERARLAA